MATFTFFHEFVGNLGQAILDLDTHTFKAVLTNAAPTQNADDELVDITQIANGNGYTTGGVTLTTVTWLETGAGTGIWQWTCDDFLWTSSGAGMATFRYVAIYNDTSTGDKLVGYLDFGSALTIPAGSTFTVDVGASGVFRLGVGVIS